MKVFVHGFWDGFLDQRDVLHIEFFKRFLGLVFGCEIELGEMHDSHILLESVFSPDTALYSRPWRYSFLFSGESQLNPWYRDYTCVLYGQKTHDNFINMPLVIPYLFCGKDVSKLSVSPSITRVPPKTICAIISNPRGKDRNYILEQIEKRIPIDYAGNYKTNVDIITEPYHTAEFSKKIGEYKFVIAFENSVGETYITEKITHGFYADTIPIYWGAPCVGEYFNEERFIRIADTQESTITAAIDLMIDLIRDDSKYLEMVNKPILVKPLTLESVAVEIRNYLSSN